MSTAGAGGYRRHLVHRPARGFPRSNDIIQIRHQLGLRIYQASHDDYRKSVLPSGYPAGSPQEVLDCACGLYFRICALIGRCDQRGAV